MSKNKISTQSYFIKRLRDSGYIVDRVFDNYRKTDPRCWTVIIDPGNASIFCTCYQNRFELGTHSYELYDGNQFVPSNLKVETSSIEVIITYLVDFGINNKARTYPRPKTVENPPTPA